MQDIICAGLNPGCYRCVVMLGMPYPNPRDPELRERMRYLDAQQLQQRQASLDVCKIAL